MERALLGLLATIAIIISFAIHAILYVVVPAIIIGLAIFGGFAIKKAINSIKQKRSNKSTKSNDGEKIGNEVVLIIFSISFIVGLIACLIWYFSWLLWIDVGRGDFSYYGELGFLLYYGLGVAVISGIILAVAYGNLEDKEREKREELEKEREVEREKERKKEERAKIREYNKRKKEGENKLARLTAEYGELKKRIYISDDYHKRNKEDWEFTDKITVFERAIVTGRDWGVISKWTSIDEFKFEDILNFEVYNNSQVVYSGTTSITESEGDFVAGTWSPRGSSFGGAYGRTASRSTTKTSGKTSQTINDYEVVLMINDLSDPTYRINFGENQKGVQEFVAILTIILEQRKKK